MPKPQASKRSAPAAQPQPAPSQLTVQLDAAEAMEAQRFFAECAGKVEGFRLGVEAVKSLYVQNLVRARQQKQQQQGQ